MPHQDSHSLGRSYTIFFLMAFVVLLGWSAWDYGGRYLHIQTFCQVSVAGISLLLAVRLLVHQRSSLILEYPLLKASLFLFLAFAMSWVSSVNQLASLEELARWLMYLMLSLAVYLYLRLVKDSSKVIQNLIASAVWIGSIIVIWGLVSFKGTDGLSSTFNRTNDLAGYLLLLIPLALHMSFVSQGLLQKIGFSIPSVILSSALIITNSRTSWLAGIAVCVLVLFWNRQRIQPKIAMVMALSLALGLLIVIVLKADLILPRLHSLTSLSILQENGTRWRMALLQVGWNMFLSQPWLGHGPNTYGTAFSAFQLHPGYYSVNPHNFYLQILAEMGLIGFLAFAFWFRSIFVLMSRANHPILPGIMASLLASCLHIAFDIDWSVSAIPILFAVLVGIGLSVSKSAETGFAEEKTLDKRIIGLWVFFSLSLGMIPYLNFLSAQAFTQASQNLDEDPTKAVEHLQRAIALAPWPSGKHYYTLALMHQENQQWPQAIEAIMRAIELDRHQARYYGLAAKLYVQAEQTPKALAMLLRRKELNPYRHPHIYSELGDLYQKEGENQLALQNYQTGRQVFDETTLAHYERYNPEDRFELFELYRKESDLYQKLNQSVKASNLDAEAQKLIRSATQDLFIKDGYPSPVAAVLGYWQQVPQHYRSSSHVFDSLLPDHPIEPPPPGLLNAEKIRFLKAHRDIEQAFLVYAIPYTKRPESWLIFEDVLMGQADGWKIIARREFKDH